MRGTAEAPARQAEARRYWGIQRRGTSLPGQATSPTRGGGCLAACQEGAVGNVLQGRIMKDLAGERELNQRHIYLELKDISDLEKCNCPQSCPRSLCPRCCRHQALHAKRPCQELKIFLKVGRWEVLPFFFTLGTVLCYRESAATAWRAWRASSTGIWGLIV